MIFSFSLSHPKAFKALPNQRSGSAVSPGHWEICQEVSESSVGHEMSPVLKSCGERIAEFSGKVFSLEARKMEVGLGFWMGLDGFGLDGFGWFQEYGPSKEDIET